MDPSPALHKPHDHAPHPRAEHNHADPASADPKAVETRGWLDRFGFGVSFLCALHCAAMPILLGAFPTLGSTLFGDERVEWFLFGAVIALGVGSLLPNYLRRHRDIRPLLLFSVGVSLLLASRIFATEGTAIEGISAAFAALLVASAHLWNLRRIRASTVVCQVPHDHVH